MNNRRVFNTLMTAERLQVNGRSMNQFRFAVEPWTGVTVVRMKCNNAKDDKMSQLTVANIVPNLIGYITSLYMSNIATIHVDGIPSDLHQTSDITGNLRTVSTRMMELVDELRKLDVGEFQESPIFRITSSNRTIVLAVTGLYSDVPIIVLTEYFNNSGICLIRKAEVTNTFNKLPSFVAMAVHKKKQQLAEDFIKSNGLNAYPFTHGFINMINRILEVYIDHQKNGKISEQSFEPDNSPLEVSIVAALVKSMKVPLVDFVIKSVQNEQAKMIDDDSNFINTIETSSIDIAKLNDRSIPIVRFSEKEWKFVEQYAMTKIVVDPDPSNYQDMCSILSDQRYGNWLNFTYTDETHSGSSNLYSYFSMDPQRKTCKFYVAYQLSPGNVVYRVMYCEDIDKFNLYTSFIRSDLRMIVKIDDKFTLPKTVAEIERVVPSCIYDKDLTIMMLVRILSMYIIIHDRPQRHKIVREEVKSALEESRNDRNKNQQGSRKTDKNDNSESEHIVVTRVLMPTKEAKEYVKKMSSDGGTGGDRNYVIESWPRRGHYRRLPGSDKQIWIDETTCNRRQPLSDKELVIKL